MRSLYLFDVNRWREFWKVEVNVRVKEKPIEEMEEGELENFESFFGKERIRRFLRKGKILG